MVGREMGLEDWREEQRKLHERIAALESALRESETRFCDVAEVHGGIVWEVDEHFIVTRISGRIREILGYEPGEIVGRSSAFLIDPEDRERVGAVMARILEKRETIKDIECWSRSKDGRRIRISTSGKAFFTPAGGLLGFRGTHLDITEVHSARQRREILLRLHEMGGESDTAISAMLCEACARQTDSPMGFFGMVEPDGSAMTAHIWSSRALAECRMPDKPVRFPIEVAGLWAEPIRRREPMIFNDYHAAPGKRGLPDGHVPITRYLGVPILVNGQVIAVAGVANKAALYDDTDILRLRLIATTIADLLAVRHAEQELRQRDRLLRTFIDFTADWEYWCMPDGRHLYDSPSCERITGFKAEEFQADPELVTRIVHADDRALFDRHRCLSAVGSASEFEFRILGKDGGLRWIHHLCRPIFRDDGTFAGARISNRDITERKRAEREKLEMERRLQHAQRLESLGVLAGGIAHDFNNILHMILTNTSFVKGESAGNLAIQKYAEGIETAAKRAATLVKQMLAYAGKGRHRVEPINLSRLSAEIGELVKASVSKKAALCFDLMPDLPTIQADAGQMSQVIMNLILNASEALGDGAGEIRVRTDVNVTDEHRGREIAPADPCPPGKYVVFEIADTGHGMDDETQTKIFDPFFTTKFTGRGLGLSAVQGIIRSHRGAIRVASAPGRGSTFTVYLPVSEGETRVHAPGLTATPAAKPGGSILVVEDEEMLRGLLRSKLAEAGFRVLEAADGAEAIEVYRLHREEIFLVLIDYMMPKLDGVQTFRELTKINSSVVAILSSGYSEEEAIEQHGALGWAGFIQKPYDLEELTEIIQKQLLAMER